jgi:hypothetical protein
MTTIFDRQFGEQAFPMLLEQYGEPVVYYLRSGGSRSFNAIVERDPPAIYDAIGNVVSASYRVRFLNNCQGGVKSSEIDAGDEISLVAEIGDARSRRFTVLIKKSVDSGVVSIWCK